MDKHALTCLKKAQNASRRELVEQNIGISKEYNNFELIKALAMKDVLKANRIASILREEPEKQSDSDDPSCII